MDPTKASKAGIAAYSMVLLHCREQLGLENWQSFVNLLQEKTGYKPPVSMFQRYQSSSFAALPNPGIAFALEAMGTLSFPNGHPVTMFALQEVVIGARDAEGNLTAAGQGFQASHGKPSH